MRKLVVIAMITLDGVMQAPGGPEEDTSGGFAYGGWVAPYEDEVLNATLKRLMKPCDLLLGRKTFGIWENYWPQNEQAWPGINEVTKYVLSSTRKQSGWTNSVFLQSVADIEKLKQSAGEEIHVWGSCELIQLLLKHDLVDEFWLLIYPITLGSGKKLFQGGAIAAAFALNETIATPSGIILANYKRAGEVKTGTAGV